MDGRNQSRHVPVCQDSAALPAAAHAADVAHLHTNTHTHKREEMKNHEAWVSICSLGRVSDLQAERQQGGPGRGPLSPLPRGLHLLAAVQQHGLDAVSIGQEERVALTGGQVPNAKALGQLRFPHGKSQERNNANTAGKRSEESEKAKRTFAC